MSYSHKQKRDWAIDAMVRLLNEGKDDRDLMKYLQLDAGYGPSTSYALLKIGHYKWEQLQQEKAAEDKSGRAVKKAKGKA